MQPRRQGSEPLQQRAVPIEPRPGSGAAGAGWRRTAVGTWRLVGLPGLAALALMLLPEAGLLASRRLLLLLLIPFLLFWLLLLLLLLLLLVPPILLLPLLPTLWLPL